MTVAKPLQDAIMLKQRQNVSPSACIGCITFCMAESDLLQPGPSNAGRFSYYFMVGVFVLLIGLHLATPLLAALFTYLALTRLHFFRRGGKWLAVLMFLVCLGAIAYGLGYFVRQTVKALPEIADKAIPSIIETARQKEIGRASCRERVRMQGGV